MPSLRIRVAVALLAATMSAPLCAQGVQPKSFRESIAAKRMFLSADRTKAASYPWCLHDYQMDAIDCSYTTRAQCEATASGGHGTCDLNLWNR